MQKTEDRIDLITVLGLQYSAQQIGILKNVIQHGAFFDVEEIARVFEEKLPNRFDIRQGGVFQGAPSSFRCAELFGNTLKTAVQCVGSLFAERDFIIKRFWKVLKLRQQDPLWKFQFRKRKGKQFFPAAPKKPALTPARWACTATFAGAPPGFLANSSLPSSVVPVGVKSINSSPMLNNSATALFSFFIS